MAERGHSSLEVTMSGLAINPEYSWLGAGPDGVVIVVHDPGCTDPNGLLQIKYPGNYPDTPLFKHLPERFLLSFGKG